MAMVFAMVLLCFDAGAQSQQHQRFASMIKDSCVELSFSFSFTYGHNSNAGNGILVYQDGMYLLKTDGFNLLCDGKSSWTLDVEAMEAVVENAPGVDLGADPKQILSLLGINTKGADIITTYRSDGMLSSLKAQLGRGNNLELKVLTYKIGEKCQSEIFECSSASLGSDWVVTDLR